MGEIPGDVRETGPLRAYFVINGLESIANFSWCLGSCRRQSGQFYTLNKGKSRFVREVWNGSVLLVWHYRNGFCNSPGHLKRDLTLAELHLSAHLQSREEVIFY